MLLQCPHCQAKFEQPDGSPARPVVQCPSCERQVAPVDASSASSASPSPITGLGPPSGAQPAPVRRQGFEPDGNESWYVLIGDEQCGPFSAAEMAQRVDSGAIDWTTAVWREGFKDWRPARRDAVLVTSIAGERGFAADTLRLDTARSLSAIEDTVIDSAPPILHDSGRVVGPSSLPPPTDSDIQTMIANKQQLPLESTGEFPLHSQNVTLGDAFQPAPGLMSVPSKHSSAPITKLRLGGVTLKLPHSLISVAAVSFAAGVLAAALWARFLGPQKSAESVQPQASAAESARLESDPVPIVAAPDADSLKRAPPGPSSLEASTEMAEEQPAPTQPQAALTEKVMPLEPTLPTRELPKSQEIRDAVREVAAPVRHCLANPKLGVDVLIYLDGPSGRVRDVQIRRPKLGPVRMRCVVNAVRRIQLEPFRRPELVYPYKFAW